MGARAIALLAGLACGLSAATELFAYLARLDPALGAPWYRAGILALYAPWDILRWAWAWGWAVPQAFQLPGLVGCVVAGITLYNAWPRTTTPTTEAHWATEAEWKQAECRSTTGIVLGKLS
jgi:hypothetical protein